MQIFRKILGGGEDNVSGGTFLFANIVVLLGVSVICFVRNEAILFEYFDGMIFRQLVHDQFVWLNGLFQRPIDPIRGLGNSFYPLNTLISPVYMLQSWVSGQVPDEIITYVGYAVMLFLGCCIAGRLCGFNWTSVIAGAWLLTAVALPYFPHDMMFPIFMMVPHGIDPIFGGVVGLVLFRLVGQFSKAKNILIMLVLVVIATYVVLIGHVAVTVHAPTLLFYGIALALGASRSELWWKVASVALVVFWLTGGGFATSIYASVVDTAAAVFPAEQNDGQRGLYFVSILFQGKSFPGGFLIGILGISGAVMRIFMTEAGTTPRRMAVVHITLVILIVGGGFLREQYMPEWNGPAMHSFEFFMWPFYAAFAGWLVVTVLAAVTRVFLAPIAVSWSVRLAVLGLPLLVALAITEPGRASSFLHPPRPSLITKHLAKEIALKPGVLFRGRVASFTGYAGRKGPVHWLRLHGHDVGEYLRIRDDHRMASFWDQGIPTLIEYSQFIRPMSYLLMSRTLARPGDRQRRNIIVFTRPQRALLELLGVRFVIAEEPLSGARETIRLSRQPNRPDLVLYELPDANVSGFSPTKVIKVDSATKVLQQLERGIDLRKTVLTDAKLPNDLSPAIASSIIVERGGLRVSVNVIGASILVLPFEFSHCLRVITDKGISARLFRADLLLTGLLVEGRTEATIILAEGALGAARCRLRDRTDNRRLALKAAAKAFAQGSVTLGIVPKIPKSN